MTDVLDDIRAAEEILNGKKYCCDDNSINSAVYLYTNELLYRYEHLFKNKKSMFSIVGSGEQIMCGALEGIERIDAVDVSRFPKQFLYLRLATLQALDDEEFIKFFHGEVNDDYKNFSDFYYNHVYEDRIRNYIDPEGLIFWDDLFSKYPWDLILYKLCRLSWRRDVPRARQMKNSIFLNPKLYYELRARLKDVYINMQTGNILDLIDKYNHTNYDVLYLSNVHNYMPRDLFNKLLCQLHTTPEGLVILGVVNGKMGKHSVGDFDFTELGEQPYKFTRKNGYITGKLAA